jgi:hypothetical protein
MRLCARFFSNHHGGRLDSDRLSASYAKAFAQLARALASALVPSPNPYKQALTGMPDPLGDYPSAWRVAARAAGQWLYWCAKQLCWWEWPRSRRLERRLALGLTLLSVQSRVQLGAPGTTYSSSWLG